MTDEQLNTMIEKLDVIIGLLKGKREKPFLPPKVADVAEYIKQRGITNVDHWQFWNHYESIAWMRGKSKVKNWKALVNTWAKKGTPPTVSKRPDVNEVMRERTIQGG